MDKDNFNANVDFVRGQADMIVLSALSDTDKYGLEILSSIQERSKGMYSLKQATLYSSLKRLEKNGYVHSYDGEISNGAKRVYYGLTQMGREHLENDKSYWEFCNFLMSNLISDNMFDPDSEDKPFDPAEFIPLTRRARGEKDDKEDKDQEKEKEVVVKYVYVKSDDIPEGADVVYVSPENIEGINNNSTVSETTTVESENTDESVTTESEITTLSDSGDEYQPSFILINGEDDEVTTVAEYVKHEVAV
ncbi:MAG: PadR family transcriptional regulator, partial [Clostridia bacterium]|nr:PadR family transcriptional regulator [Clostridia bacterium]